MNVIVRSEPNVKKVCEEESGWIVNKLKKVAVKMCSGKIRCLNYDVEKGFVWMRFNRWALYSCYAFPNATLEKFGELLGGFSCNDARKN